MNRRLWVWLLVAGVLTAAGPQPPCGDAAFPAYPEVDRPPVVKAWKRDELDSNWLPPACTGWTEPGFSMLVATAARFRNPSTSDALLRLIGAISGLKGMPYWSTTHQGWRPLILDAFALSGPSGTRRGDFSPDELTAGSSVYFSQEDSLSGKGIYELRIVTATPDKLVIDIHNTSTLHFLMVPIFHPGDVQSLYFLDRESPEVWRYYNLARLGQKSSGLAAGHAASSINRAVAFYRHLAGIPGEQEPPPAR